MYSHVSCPSQTEKMTGTVQIWFGAVWKRCQLHIVGVPGMTSGEMRSLRMIV